VEIVVKGRRTDVPERFRRHVTDKLGKVERLDPRILRIDVEVSRERNPRLSRQSERIELTCQSKGPAIRAEAAADDPYAALDVAYAKLEERLRRAAGRRRVHHGNRTPVSVAAATAPLAAGDLTSFSSNGHSAATATADHAGDEHGGVETAAGRIDGDGPMVIREKVHTARPMTLDQALYEMELVGHDFFLFVDETTSCPSVVYRRRGYDYGVIRLRLDELAEDEAAPVRSR
jgi:ribosomal subunit interface protein